MKIPANRLSGHLDKSLLPCYLVSGDEPLLAQEALDAIRAAARARGFSNREVVEADARFDWDTLAAASGNLSLFAEKRIVELTIPTGKPGREGSAAIAEFVERLDDDLLLIVITPKLDQRAQGVRWVKALAETGGHIAVWPLDRSDLPDWIVARMRKAGMQPTTDAVRLIADRVEGNLLAAQQEIDKLRLLLDEGEVTAEHIERAVADSSRFDIYKLVDTAVAGDARRALRMLNGVRAEGVPAVLVLWALTREIRTLCRLGDAVSGGVNLAAAMAKLRVWKNRQGVVRSCVGRHRRADFYALLKALREADAAAKGQGPGDAWLLATDIVLALAGGQARAA